MVGCAWAQTKLPAANGVRCVQRSFRCAKNGVALRANCTSATRGGFAGKRADFRGNYASKSAIMHKIAETAKNRILRGFDNRQFCGKNGGKNRKNRLAGASIHHANKSPPHKHENRIRASKTHKCAVLGLFSAIFPPIYAPKNTLFPPQQIIVIHCEYPQTPCAPMALSLA